MNTEYKTLQPTSRFSNRAENYMRFRPSYPPELVAFLERTLGLQKIQRVADIGSGTGLFADLLLRQGYSVDCVEPNEDMREKAENKLGHYAGFRSIAKRAEQTGLEDDSVDLITVAQAFHWMEPIAAKEEFNRILKPGGHIVLVWNLRQTHTPFLAGYDELKSKFSLEPPRKMINEEAIRSFFEPGTMRVQNLAHAGWLDFDSLKGLLLSSSGIPLPGHISYDTMISSLIQLFVSGNINGFVLMEYETRIYYC